jgi:NADP-dependent 3-hydroxy acid dehydrogenase YdfG
MNLQGAAAVVTGASLGIGLAVSEALLARGARVFGLARDAQRLADVAGRLGAAFVAQPCDVGDSARVRTAMRAAHERLGAIDIVVNNAGIGLFGAVDRMPEEQWEAMLATNLSGTYHCIREAVPVMKAQGRGHIVNIASIAALVGYPQASGYNATKFAVRGLTDALAKELAPAGIKVTALFPGTTETGFGNRTPSSAAILQPADVAAAVVHVLESPDRCLVSEMVLRPFP